MAASGIRGLVLLGPTCPVEPSDGSACVTPYAATIAVLDDAETTVATIRSGPDGRFEVALPPGHYLLVPASGDPLPTAEPVGVVVEPGEFVVVQIDYDSGIR